MQVNRLNLEAISVHDISISEKRAGYLRFAGMPEFFGRRKAHRLLQGKEPSPEKSDAYDLEPLRLLLAQNLLFSPALWFTAETISTCGALCDVRSTRRDSESALGAYEEGLQIARVETTGTRRAAAEIGLALTRTIANAQTSTRTRKGSPAMIWTIAHVAVY